MARALEGKCPSKPLLGPVLCDCFLWGGSDGADGHREEMLVTIILSESRAGPAGQTEAGLNLTVLGVVFDRVTRAGDLELIGVQCNGCQP